MLVLWRDVGRVVHLVLLRSDRHDDAPPLLLERVHRTDDGRAEVVVLPPHDDVVGGVAVDAVLHRGVEVVLGLLGKDVPHRADLSRDHLDVDVVARELEEVRGRVPLARPALTAAAPADELLIVHRLDDGGAAVVAVAVTVMRGERGRGEVGRERRVVVHLKPVRDRRGGRRRRRDGRGGGRRLRLRMVDVELHRRAPDLAGEQSLVGVAAGLELVGSLAADIEGIGTARDRRV